MTSLLKIAGVQINPKLMDKSANLALILRHLEDTAASGAHLVVFPECSLSGYCFESQRKQFPTPNPFQAPQPTSS